MSLFTRETLTKLKTLIVQTIADFGEVNLTNAQAVTAALPKAREILADEYDAVVCATLRPMVQSQLAKGEAPAYARVPMLIPDLPKLPYRIAVPSLKMMDDDDYEDSEDEKKGITWIVLHKATIAEVTRSKDMIQSHIDGSQVKVDKLQRIIKLALARTSDENAVIGEILAGVPA